MTCRHCNAELQLDLIDLGNSPPSNAYLTRASLEAPETWLPLRVAVCESCWLAQTTVSTAANDLFTSDYAYFSGVSQSWLEHCGRYVADVTTRFRLDGASHVVEVASNDGYLLQFVKERGIPCTGVEPTASTAAAARAKGIPVIEEFFGRQVAERLQAERRAADLMIANNVLAHVPDINDFAAGFAALLKPSGVATFEFPWLLELLDHVQFDTIYHEHYSYLSLGTVTTIFERNGLEVFDVETLPTHGGSLRVYAQRRGGMHRRTPQVDALMAQETTAGLASRVPYAGFQSKADAVKDGFLRFLLDCKRDAKKVVGYGAAAKGNTLINYAGVRPDFLPYVVDRSPAKQGRFLPGSRIPIVAEEKLREQRPDFIVILPWNLKTELVSQLSYAREWGARFVTAVPKLEVLE